MDSNEFVQMQQVAQRGMVERGEVMPALMIATTPGDLSGCFWCGESTDVLLFGKLRDESKKAFGTRMIDTATPHDPPTDFKPCGDCREIMGRGICLTEITGSEEKPEVTGRYWVVTPRYIRAIVKFQALADDIIAERKTCISHEAAKRIGLFDGEASA